MIRGCYLILVLIIWIGINSRIILAETVPMVVERGNHISYTVDLGDNIGLLSRDGSYPIVITDALVVNQSGNYFLSFYNQDNEFCIERFTIDKSEKRSIYEVDSPEELSEVIKVMLENYQQKAIIQLNYGNWSVEGMSSLLETTFEKIIYTYPDITYDRYQFVARTGYKPSIELEIQYPGGLDKFVAYSEQADQELVQIINEIITPDMKDYERQEAIVDYIINCLSYAAEDEDMMKHTLQGAIVDGRAVCDGYSNMSMYLLNAVGVPTVFVVGTANEQPHAWNKVRIQGDYYHMDTTWADQDNQHMSNYYNYINETDSYMQRTHQWEDNGYLPAHATQYSSIHRPIDDKGIYRISDPTEWEIIEQTIGEDNLEYGTIIFYNTRKYNWNEEEILKEIVVSEGIGIEYYIDKKYDSLIITYKWSV